ncbi:MAG TPA: metallophosphoesterase, partial [Candidatus Lokiarchaeia archaeon]|nr:metallophosphoesterase [Candidatus Lokiarchaeia archaeon]
VPWYKVPLSISAVSGPSQGTCLVTTSVPAGVLFGLYDLEVAVMVGSTNFTLAEQHSVYVYNASALTQLNFAQFSDPHVIYPDQEVAFNVAPPNQAPIIQNVSYNGYFEKLFAETSITRPTFIIVTGDIANAGQEQEFQEMRAILQTSSVPVLTLLGNHDHRSPPSFNYYLAPSYYARSIGPWRIIILDSGASEGNGLFGEQLTWYEHELQLAQAARQQILVFMHIPSAPEPTDGWLIAGNAEFRALNLKYGVRAIFAGHHHDFEATFANGTTLNTYDPVPVAAGPIYVITGSPTIADNTNDFNYYGWRWVTSFSNGDIAMGYDLNGTGQAYSIYGMPRNGLNQTDGTLSMSVTNNYNKPFYNVTLPETFDLGNTRDHLYPSIGTVVTQVWGPTNSTVFVRFDLPANTTESITFTRSPN